MVTNQVSYTETPHIYRYTRMIDVSKSSWNKCFYYPRLWLMCWAFVQFFYY